jgi:hypothetical protein
MQNRFDETNKIIKMADKICFISNTNADVGTLRDFLSKMGGGIFLQYNLLKY